MTRLFRELHLHKLRRLTAGGAHHLVPTLSPNGRWCAHLLSQGSRTHLLITDRKGRICRVFAGPVVGRATVTNDGRVAFTRQVGATCEIWLLQNGESEPQRLLGGDGRLYREPSFSPDGTQLAFLADDGNPDAPLQLGCFDFSHGRTNRLLLPDPDGRFLQTQWAPFGDSIFVSAATPLGSAVFEVSIASAKAVQRGPFGLCSPAPLVPGLLCATQQTDEQQAALVLVSYSPFADRLRVLLERKLGAGEPAVALHKKGHALIAFTMPDNMQAGEPPRRDLYLGQLAGLAALAGVARHGHKGHDRQNRGAESKSEAEASAESAGGAETSHNEAAVASLPPFHDIWCQLERGV